MCSLFTFPTPVHIGDAMLIADFKEQEREKG